MEDEPIKDIYLYNTTNNTWKRVNVISIEGCETTTDFFKNAI